MLPTNSTIENVDNKLYGLGDILVDFKGVKLVKRNIDNLPHYFIHFNGKEILYEIKETYLKDYELLKDYTILRLEMLGLKREEALAYALRICDYVLTKLKPEREALEKLKELAERVRVSEKEEIMDKIYEYIRSKYILVNIYDTLECYDNGVYVECEKKIMRDIEIKAEEYGLKPKVRKAIVKEVVEKLKRRYWKDPRELNMSWFTLKFENGLLDVEEFINTGFIELKPFTPQIYVEHRIPHRVENLNEFMVKEYGLEPYMRKEIDIVDLAEKQTPTYYKLFKEWVNEDKQVTLLYEIIGYCFYKAYPIHRAFMLVGDGSNGKSTYLSLLRNILGKENVVSITLQALAEQRFAPILLFRKLANIYADLPKSPLRYTGTFKILTGEDQITADRKFKEPISFTNYAKLIFSANELPKVTDQTLAFWRRWIVVDFPNKFPDNPEFKKNVLTLPEKPKLITVSLYALRNVMIRGDFTVKAEFKDKWLRMTNTVYAFLQDLFEGKIEGYRAEKDPDAKIETSELYSIYVNYCNKEELEALAKRDFTIEMERQGFRRVKVKGTYYYKGLKLIEENSENKGLEQYQ